MRYINPREKGVYSLAGVLSELCEEEKRGNPALKIVRVIGWLFLIGWNYGPSPHRLFLPPRPMRVSFRK